MASTSMQTVLNKSPIQGGGSLASHSLPKKAQVFTPARVQQRRAVPSVVASASKGPSDVFMQGVGALAAAQMMLFPMAANADLLPKTATSESARAELNQRTSDLPSLKDVGGAIKDALPGGGNDVQNKAQDLADKAGSEASKAANKVQNATPDLSSAEVGRQAEKLGKKAGNAVSNAPNNLSAPNVDLKGAANKAKAQANKIGNKISNATPDLSDASSDAKNFANKVGNKVNKAANNLTNAAPDLGDAKTAANQAKSKANKVGSKISNATPDLSDAGSDAKGLANKIGNKVSKAANDLTNAAPDLGDAKSAVKDARNTADKNSKKIANATTPDLSDAGSDIKSFVDKAAGKLDANTPDLSDVQGAANKARNAAGDAATKVQNDAGDAKSAVKNALPDLSELPSLKGAADKAGEAFNKAGQTTDKYTPDQKATGFNPFKFAARDAKAAKDAVGESSDVKFEPDQRQFGEANKAGQNNESLERTTERILEQSGEKSENIGKSGSQIYGVEKQ